MSFVSKKMLLLNLKWLLKMLMLEKSKNEVVVCSLCDEVN